MVNIWEFLLQTGEISLTAVILLCIKWMFRDKLSPRWQYGIWVILAIKLLMPVGLFGNYMSLNLAAWIDMMKYEVEQNLVSQFVDACAIIRPVIGIPMITSMPESITDWIFVLYIIGAVAFLCYYLWGYIRLRLIIKGGWSPAKMVQDKLECICEKYNLKPCKVCIIDGVDSAFICGWIHPVLVIPAAQEETIDEKILLHELIHRKYLDGWQNGFWCVMRSIHWCNPIMQYVCNHIGNDMESLCDQRVLERLSGEERRAYGSILLDMTNQKYARAMGTTSLSNGGKNIKKRIEAIVRFKKYPKGMALVSVCICLILACPVFGGINGTKDLSFDYDIIGDQQHRMAKARLQGCSTQAGAIDTFARGVFRNDMFYLSAALPENQKYQVEQFSGNDGIWPLYEKYEVLNLMETEKDVYEGQLLFRSTYEEEEDPSVSAAILPIRLQKEDGRWVVASTGEAESKHFGEDAVYDYDYMDNFPAQQVWEKETENGKVTIMEQTHWYVRTAATDDAWFASDEGDLTTDWANPNAEFARKDMHYKVIYDSYLSEIERSKIEHIAISTKILTKQNAKPDWSRDFIDMGSGGGSSSDGGAILSEQPESIWDGHLEMDYGYYVSEKDFEEAESYAVRLYINGKAKEGIQLERRNFHESNRI